MDRPQNLRELDLPLERVGVPPSLVDLWNRTQGKFLSQDFLLLEYQCQLDQVVCPILFADMDKEFEDKIVDKTHSVNFQLYEEVRIKNEKFITEQFTEKTRIKGLFIPALVIKNIKAENWQYELYFLQRLAQKFQIGDFTLEIIRAQKHKEITQLTIVKIGLHYLEKYYQGLKEIHAVDPIAFEGVVGIKLFYRHVHAAGQSKINESLLFLNYLVESTFFINEDRESYWKLRIEANPLIRELDRLWENFLAGRIKWRNILEFYESVEEEKFEPFSQFMYNNRTDFTLPSKIRSLYVQIDELLKVDKKRFGGLFTKARPEEETSQSSLFELAHELIPSSIYSLDGNSIDKLKTFITAEVNKSFRSKWLKMYQEGEQVGKWSQGIEILNQLCAPFFRVDMKGGRIVPCFETLSSLDFNSTIKAFQSKQELRRKQEDYLQYLMKRITKIYSFEELALEFESYKFSFSDLQESWNSHYEAAKRSLDIRLKFRHAKMEEYGILDTKVMSGHGKDSWLDELLQIEEEVAGYTIFVKEAFAQALPVRRISKFHAIRRTIDGVEVDPEALLVPEKYLRAEIMKPMTSVKDYKNIHQLNTFCLDTSGSMNHERMRNLFKLLYLLVLGLEDKVSYDSFHFFSNKFVSGVEFGTGFTNKKVLFKILTSISTLKNGKVIYSGTGGTNIGDGMKKSYERIQEFGEKLVAKYPDILIVKSMFVISDGEPSLGLINLDDLKELVEKQREESNISINGLYIFPEEEATSYMTDIFGASHAIEADNFDQTVTGLVNLMIREYKQQRIDHKWRLKAQKLINHE